MGRSRIQQKQKRLRKRRRQLERVAFGVGIVAVIGIVGFGGYYFSNEYFAQPLETQQTATTEMKAKPKKPATANSKSAKVEKTDATTDSSSEKQKSEQRAMAAKDDPETKLLAGKNHNQKAAAYAYSTKQIREYMEGQVAYEGERICFLTFDDGANDVITPQVLDVLKKYQVPATFFVVGKYVNQATKPLLEREIAEGHAIALHSDTHDYDLLYPNRVADPSRIAQEAQTLQQKLQAQLGTDFHSPVWRYPGGHMSWQGVAAADSQLQQQGIEYIDWNAMSGDAESPANQPKNAEEMAAYQANSITGFPDHHVRIVLMHDAPDKELTPQALPKIIEFYQQHGFKFGVLG